MKKIIGFSVPLVLIPAALSYLPAQATEITPATSSDTLIATMYEWEQAYDVVDSNGDPVGEFSGDEYAYRISKNNEDDVVDLQWMSYLNQLTEAEQNSYYEDFWKFDQADTDPNVDAYQFNWVVAAFVDSVTEEVNFATDDPITGSTQPLPPNGDGTITTEQLDLFWEMSPAYYRDYESPILGTAQYLKHSTTPIRDSGPAGSSALSFPEVELADGTTEFMMVSSGAYAVAVCPAGSMGYWVDIVDEDGTQITSRSLDLSQGVYIRYGEPELGEPLPTLQVELDGAHIAVYGATVDNFTVAHLGVTKIEDQENNTANQPVTAGSSFPSSSDTLVATMYEWEKSFNLGYDEGFLGTFQGDEYFYRISTANENNVVDLQWTSGLTKLTESQQNYYYRDFWKFSDENPYEFTWMLPFCLDEDSLGSGGSVLDALNFRPNGVRTTFQEVFPVTILDDEDNLVEFVTPSQLEKFWEISPQADYERDEEGDTARLGTAQYLKKYSNGTHDPLTQAPVGTTELSFPNFSLADEQTTEFMMKSSGAYAVIDCPEGQSGGWLQIHDGDGNQVTTRSLDLNDGVFLEIQLELGGQPVSTQIDLDGAYIAVYGEGGGTDPTSSYTVAHLGVTKIEEPNYTVSYHPNGASEGNLPDDDSVSSGSFTPTSNSGNLKRPGFIFKGWSDDFRSTTAQASVNITGETRLYAVWEAQTSGSASNPTPYSGPIITTVGFGPNSIYSTASTSPIVISGDRLAGVTGAFVAGQQAEILDVSNQNFTILLPKGLPEGTHDLFVETTLGDLTYLDAITVTSNLSFGEVSAWTKRISDTQVKVYVKYPTVGEKVRISHQTGGSGSYESVYVKTTSSETMQGLRTVEGVGTYIVRTVNLSDINRIRVTVGDEEIVQVRYNN